MAIQINTDSLTKSHHFIFEACKILLRHKKVFFAFAALPILLDVVENTFSRPHFQGCVYEINPHYKTIHLKDHTRVRPEKERINLFFTLLSRAAFFLKWLIAIPFCGVAWFKYFLDPVYSNTLRFYFTIDKRFFKYLTNTLGFLVLFIAGKFLMTVLMLALFAIYAIFLGGENTLFYNIVMSYISVLPSLGLNTIDFPFVLEFFFTAIPLNIGFWIIVSYFSSSMFILPSIALSQPLKIPIIEDSNLPHVFRTLISLCLFLVIGSNTLIKLMALGKYMFFTNYLNVNETQYILFSMLVAIFVSLINAIVLGIFSNVMALYYKLLWKSQHSTKI